MNSISNPTPAGTGLAPAVSLTETGRLSIGIVIDGVRHQDFELRPATVRDNVEASLEVGSASAIELLCATFARQLVRFGTLPASAITTDLLLDLNPNDWNAIEAANTELEKKLRRDGQPWNGGQPVAPSSPATA